jgi:hypothetical protein
VVFEITHTLAPESEGWTLPVPRPPFGSILLQLHPPPILNIYCPEIHLPYVTANSQFSKGLPSKILYGLLAFFIPSTFPTNRSLLDCTVWAILRGRYESIGWHSCHLGFLLTTSLLLVVVVATARLADLPPLTPEQHVVTATRSGNAPVSFSFRNMGKVRM